jgi:hypothetical protein
MMTHTDGKRKKARAGLFALYDLKEHDLELLFGNFKSD